MMVAEEQVFVLETLSPGFSGFPYLVILVETPSTVICFNMAGMVSISGRPQWFQRRLSHAHSFR